MLGILTRHPWLTISFACLLFYGHTVGFDFTYDDFPQIFNNPLVLASLCDSAATWQLLSSPTIPGDLYRPLTLLSYRVNFLLFGIAPWSYHLLNILLHLVVSLLTFQLAKPLVRSPAVALVAALVFAVHPIHIEAVANIIGRAELLAAMFICLAMLASTSGINSITSQRQNFWLITSLLLYLLATLCKESSLAAFPLIPLYAYLSSPLAARSQIRNKLIQFSTVLVLVTLLTLLLRLVVLGDKFTIQQDTNYFHSENPLLYNTTFLQRLFPGLVIIGKYLQLLVIPFNLSIDYSSSFATYWNEVYSLSGAAHALLAVSMAILTVAVRRTGWSFFGAWFLITFALTCNIITPIGTIMAERLAYLPSIGFCIFFVCLIDKFIFIKIAPLRMSYLLPVVYILLLVTLGMPRTFVWQNNRAVFTQGAIDNPSGPKAHYNLAEFYQHESGELDLAYYSYLRAFALQPTMIPAAIEMAKLSLMEENYVQAKHWCQEVLRLAPKNEFALSTMQKLEAQNVRLPQ
jgi:4-amino-4-deoxy-L-arabinose transferase-like glycosyltransferase